MSKTIDLEQIPVIKELVQEEIEKKTTPIEDEIEDIKKTGTGCINFCCMIGMIR